MPVNSVKIEGHPIVASFIEKDMDELLSGLSLQSDTNETTFCNIYTRDGESLTNMVLGSLAAEDNLLSALKNAEFEKGYSFEQVEEDFRRGRANIISFTYNGIRLQKRILR